MVELKGKPIINWLYDNLTKVPGIDYIYIVSGYRYNILEPYVKTYLDPNIRFIRQQLVNGTANAISLLENKISKEFMVLSGDTIYKQDDLKMLVKYNNSLLYTERNIRLYEFGTLDLGVPSNPGEGFKIKYINEKSSRPTSNLVNCGAYHFDYRIFKYIKETQEDPRFREKIITNSINLMIDDGIEFRGLYMDKLLEVSYPEDIKEVETEL
jgi:glucose-1-phosphate thymidylyltransferase